MENFNAPSEKEDFPPETADLDTIMLYLDMLIGSNAKTSAARAVPRTKPKPVPVAILPKPTIMDKDAFLDKMGREYIEPKTLGKLLEDYAGIDPTTDPTGSARLGALRQIDAAAYAWFNKTRATNLSDVKGAETMKDLLAETEAAHEAMVEAAKNDPAILPIDTTGLSADEIQERGVLWRAIVDGTGKLTVGGSAAFQQKTRARMAKMLETPTGARMLKFLNTPKGDTADPDSRIIFGDTLPDDVRNAKQHMAEEDRDVSYALEFSSDRGAKALKEEPVKGDENPAEYPTLTKITDLRDAILDGKKGCLFNGKKYTFGPGSGSFVKTVQPQPGDEDSDLAGPDNTEIITPGFVTLAHELGHAINIRAGAATRDLPDLMTALWDHPTEKNAEVIKDRWTNSEEFFNIIGIENAIRQDAGLPIRAAHKTKTAMIKMDLMTALYQRFNLILAKDPCVSSIPEVMAAMNTMDKAKGKSDDEKVYEALSQLVEGLDKKVVTPKNLVQFKKTDLLERKSKLDEVAEAKKGALKQAVNQTHQTEYEAINRAFKKDMATLTAVGTNDWSDMCRRIRELRFALEKLE